MGARREMIRESNQAEELAQAATDAAAVSVQAKMFIDAIQKRSANRQAAISMAEQELKQARIKLSEIRSAYIGSPYFFGFEIRGAHHAAVQCCVSAVQLWEAALVIANRLP